MVATLAQAASASYYLESQRSFRHPNEYYTAGEEPDGVWFNPGGPARSRERRKGRQRRLPTPLQWLRAGRLQQAHQERRQRPAFAGCGHDLLGRQERVCALGPSPILSCVVRSSWRTTTPPGWRWKRQCSATARIRGSGTRKGGSGSCLPTSPWRCSSTAPAGRTTRSFIPTASSSTRPAPAKTASGGQCTSTRSTAGPRPRAPVYRNALAWNLRERLGIRMEQYGPNSGFTCIEGMPEDLQVFWSKRRKAIVAKAGELGIPSLGNASRMAGVNKLTRAGKSHDNDPEVRHRRWMGRGRGIRRARGADRHCDRA